MKKRFPCTQFKTMDEKLVGVQQRRGKSSPTLTTHVDKYRTENLSCRRLVINFSQNYIADSEHINTETLSIITCLQFSKKMCCKLS